MDEHDRGYLGKPDAVCAAVARHFGIELSEMLHGRRSRHRSIARNVAALLLYESGYYSHSDVARILHYADHTSARDAVLTALERIHSDPRLLEEVNTLRAQLRARLEEHQP